MPDFLIDDDTNPDFYMDPMVDGEVMGRGAIPRDYEVQPMGSSSEAEAFPIIARSEWSARIKEMESTKSRLSDIRRNALGPGKHIPALDQGRLSYCWAYSTGMALILTRAVANMPYVRLSPTAVAAKIKNFANRGGWGALSMEFAVKNGYPSETVWPNQSLQRHYDCDQTWEDAKRHRVTAGWWDLSKDVYSRNLPFDVVMTLLLCRVPVVVDFNWWGHSVCAIDPVEVEPGSFGIRIINSWKDSWGDLGESVLRGNKAHPDGSVAPRVITASSK
jgi:hypothetical protein